MGHTQKIKARSQLGTHCNVFTSETKLKQLFLPLLPSKQEPESMFFSQKSAEGHIVNILRSLGLFGGK